MKKPVQLTRRDIFKLAAAMEADPRTIVSFVGQKKRTTPAIAAAIIRAAAELGIKLPPGVGSG